MTSSSTIVCGLFVKTLLVAVFVQLFTDKGIKRSTRDQLKENRWIVLGGSLLVAYLLLLWFDAVLLCLFTVLLPFCLTFIHASLRLRNIKNKVANALDSLNPTSTPMGKFLMAMNIIVENNVLILMIRYPHFFTSTHKNLQNGFIKLLILPLLLSGLLPILLKYPSSFIGLLIYYDKSL
uniref:PRA1 family protein n=1 Tax=Megaselia scalaris TaxID=36166 RepID=T1GA02_MEGSC